MALQIVYDHILEVPVRTTTKPIFLMSCKDHFFSLRISYLVFPSKITTRAWNIITKYYYLLAINYPSREKFIFHAFLFFASFIKCCFHVFFQSVDFIIGIRLSCLLIRKAVMADTAFSSDKLLTLRIEEVNDADVGDLRRAI